MGEVYLTELIDVSILQQLQDGFSKFTGMAALTTDADGIPVTRGSGFTDFCTNLVRKSARGCERCEECDRLGAVQTLKTQKPAIYMCHAGLMDYAAPIMLEGRIIGSFIGGQVRTEELDEEFMRKKAEELDIDPDAYIAAARKTCILDMESVEKAAVYLSEIARVISELAYRNFQKLQTSRRLEQAARSQSAYIMNLSMNMKNRMQEWLVTTENALGSSDAELMKETLHKLAFNGQEVLQDIDNTIDYVRLTSGKLELSESTYHVRYMLSQVMESARIYAGEKGISLSYDVEQSVPEYLLGDSGRIGQIINKLIYIGIESISEGKIFVGVTCKKKVYSVQLDILVRVPYQSVVAKQIDTLSHLIETEEQDYLGTENDNLSMSTVVLLVKQLAGTILVSVRDHEEAEFQLSFQQLEVKGEL